MYVIWVIVLIVFCLGIAGGFLLVRLFIQPVQELHKRFEIVIKEMLLILAEKERVEREHSKLLQAVEEKNIELQRLDRLKSDFVATVSHELRMPLAISMEGINLLLDGVVGKLDDHQQQVVTTSRDNMVRLNTIINDLLDIQKIEAGKIVLKKGFVDYKNLVMSLVNDYKKILSRKKQQINAFLPIEDMIVFADGDKIIQVLMNLLNNAHKFTPEGGMIEVAVIKSEGEVLTAVKDSGIGIPKEEMGKLFNKFQQIDREEGEGARGTGLGLSIAKALIQLHGGRIWAESELGKGSSFNFIIKDFAASKRDFEKGLDHSLEKALVAREDLTVIVLHLVNGEELLRKQGRGEVIKVMNKVLVGLAGSLNKETDMYFGEDLDTAHIILPTTGKAGALAVIGRIKTTIQAVMSRAGVQGEWIFTFGVGTFGPDLSSKRDVLARAKEDALRPKTILLVDDDVHSSVLLQGFLHDQGVRIESALDGEEGMEKIRTVLPDLVIADIMLPRMNGYELIGRIKGASQTAQIPVIIITAKEMEAVYSEYEYAGKIPIFHKTEDPTRLVRTVLMMLPKFTYRGNL